MSVQKSLNKIVDELSDKQCPSCGADMIYGNYYHKEFVCGTHTYQDPPTSMTINESSCCKDNQIAQLKEQLNYEKAARQSGCAAGLDEAEKEKTNER